MFDIYTSDNDYLSHILEKTATWVCVNGRILQKTHAKISPFDRGFLFADGVYEGVGYAYGRMIDNQAHFARLRQSLAVLQIHCPWSDTAIANMQHDLLEKNTTQEGFCYYQITRGVANRDFSWPESMQANLFMFLQPKALIAPPLAQVGVSVITVEDLRWKHRNIKTIAILPQALAKAKAHDQGAFEAWLVEDDLVNEGASTSAFIVDANNTLVTAPLGNKILPGVTRAAVLRIAKEQGIDVNQRHFSPSEAIQAHEAFVTSATTLVMPVVCIDGCTIGNGAPGAITQLIRKEYIAQYCS